ncbi:MAG: hypothetical protein AB8H03_04725 [Saprospiraceae bacterium]
MQFSRTQFQVLVTSIFLLGICCLVLKNPTGHEPVESQKSTSLSFDQDTTFLFQKKVISNRLPKFIHFLKQHCIPIHNDYELLLLFSNPYTRQRVSHQIGIDTNLLLLHAELADLMQIGMTELDAQVILFSQRNYQNPFSGEMMNLRILEEANAERILEDIGGWMAGNENPVFQNYCLSIEDIEFWIDQAKHQNFKIFTQIP